MSLPLLRRAIDVVVATPFRLLPRGRRFDAMLSAGRLLSPILGPLFVRRHPGFTTAGRLDETMRLFLRAAQRRDLRFEPRVVVDAPAGFVPAGALFLTAHFPLNGLFVRWLHEQGLSPTIVRENPVPMAIPGSGVPLEQIASSPTVLLQIRSRIARGQPVLMAVVPARPEWPLEPIETRFGQTTVASSAFLIARRLGLPLFFFGVRMTGSDPILTIRPIEPDVASFAEMLRRHLEVMVP